MNVETRGAGGYFCIKNLVVSIFSAFCLRVLSFYQAGTVSIYQFYYTSKPSASSQMTCIKHVYVRQASSQQVILTLHAHVSTPEQMTQHFPLLLKHKHALITYIHANTCMSLITHVCAHTSMS